MYLIYFKQSEKVGIKMIKVNVEEVVFELPLTSDGITDYLKVPELENLFINMYREFLASKEVIAYMYETNKDYMQVIESAFGMDKVLKAFMRKNKIKNRSIMDIHNCIIYNFEYEPYKEYKLPSFMKLRSNVLTIDEKVFAAELYTDNKNSLHNFYRPELHILGIKVDHLESSFIELASEQVTSYLEHLDFKVTNYYLEDELYTYDSSYELLAKVIKKYNLKYTPELPSVWEDAIKKTYGEDALATLTNNFDLADPSDFLRI